MTKHLQKYTLLYVEDEIVTKELVSEYLKKYFLEIFQASDGKSAYKLYLEKKPDIVITDIQIENMNGLELATNIRKIDQDIPILITTAYTDTNYLLKAVELNLIKYLVKPINEKELQTALKICFKKLETSFNAKVNLGDGYIYDAFNFVLLHDSKIITLTSSQNKFLELLIQNKNRVVTYTEIEYYIWGYNGMSEAALRSLVHDIRKILHKNIIKNISKIGYKINIYE